MVHSSCEIIANDTFALAVTISLSSPKYILV